MNGPEPAGGGGRRWWLAVAGVGVFAALVRIVVLFVHGRDIAFLKYVEGARLLSEGKLDGARVLDFSPLYLELHRVARLCGLVDLDLLRVLQCLAGAATCVLICLIGANLIGRAVGLLAGALAALLFDLALYDGVLEPEALLLLLFASALWLLSVGSPRASWRWRLAAGVLLGLAVATRPAAWLPALAVVGGLAFVGRGRGPRARMMIVAPLMVGLALVQLGLSLRNRAYGDPAAMSPWQVLYTGNNPAASGLWQPDFLVKDLERGTRGDAPDHAHRLFREVAVASGGQGDRYWLSLSLAFAREYPLRWLTIVGQKLIALGQPHNPHDIGTVFRLQRRLESWPLIGTSLIVPLGAIGLLLQRRRLALVGLAALGQLGVCAIFFVSARYRLFLLPWLGIGAAALLHPLGAALLARLRGHPAGGLSGRTLVLALVATAVAATLFRLPLAPGTFASIQARLLRRSQPAYLKAWELRQADRLQQAAGQLSAALYPAPWIFLDVALSRVPFPLPAQRMLERARADALRTGTPWAWLRLGYLLDLAGEDARAVAALEQVQARARWPGEQQLVYMALLRRGLAHLRAKDGRRAQAAFARASTLRPGASGALIGLSLCARDAAAASALITRAARVNPRLEVLYRQGRMALLAGRPREALGPLERLSEALPHYARARMLLALALGRVGRTAAAISQVVRAQRDNRFLFDPEFSPLALLSRAAAAAPPTATRPWQRLATFAELYGDLEQARRAWGALERRRPLSARETVRLGWLLLRHERPAAALPLFERALGQAPAEPHAREGRELARQRLAETAH